MAAYEIYNDDCLARMKDIPDNSIQLILTDPDKASISDEDFIIYLYETEKYTLRYIADIVKSNHHMIKKILIKNGIKIDNKNRIHKPLSEEHKLKISASSKGRTSYWKGKQLPEEAKRKNFVGHIKLDRTITIEEIEKYTDFKKLTFFTKLLYRYKKHFNTVEKYFAIIDKYYFDERFNYLYNNWLKHNKNKWYFPSLDHKISLSHGGGWDLDNLQIITWFENRAKAEMNFNEWEQFKKDTHTTSEMFI